MNAYYSLLMPCENVVMNGREKCRVHNLNISFDLKSRTDKMAESLLQLLALLLEIKFKFFLKQFKVLLNLCSNNNSWAQRPQTLYYRSNINFQFWISFFFSEHLSIFNLEPCNFFQISTWLRLIYHFKFHNDPFFCL